MEKRIRVFLTFVGSFFAERGAVQTWPEVPAWIWFTGAALCILFILVTSYPVVLTGPWVLVRKLFGQALKTQPPRDSTDESAATAAAVDYLSAGAIVDAYIAPATRDMPSHVKLAVRKDFIDRFDKMTGAKLGEYKYNAALLRQWMESNAARFLVERRHEML